MSVEISTKAQEHLQAWSQRGPVMGVMGEFSAGKSTLANFLLGRDILPQNVTATNLPVVWFTYGQTRSIYGLRHDGTLEEVSFEDLKQDLRERFLLLRVTDDSETLQEMDMVDTPGLSDPKLPKGATLFLGPYLDFVLWCSSAIQAWRKTERTAWLQFPESLRERSLLVLTRADKVKSQKDLNKVLNRVSRETEDLFSSTLALSTPDALAALRSKDLDAEAWEASGGAALMGALARSINARTEAPKASIAAPDPIFGEQTSDADISPEEPQEQFSAIAAFRDALHKIDPILTFAQASTFFNQLYDELVAQNVNNPAHQSTLRTLLDVGQSGNVDVQRLLGQVEMEIQDFDTVGRCRLHPA